MQGVARTRGKFRTADFPLLLIFHDPVAKRARRRRRRQTPRSGVGASEACVPGAEREIFSLLDLSRDCGKFRSAVLSLLPISHHPVAEPC
jgi:hypothetical protein